MKKNKIAALGIMICITLCGCQTNNSTKDTTPTPMASEKSEKGHGMGNGDGMKGQGGGRGQGMATQNDPVFQTVIDENSSKFQQLTFKDEQSGISLEYNLYVPQDYDETKEYPLLMYIPDSTGVGKTAKEIVEQYYGADIWVTQEEQAKHASLVLVPAFSEVVTNDDWSTSDQIDVAVRLINELTQKYSVDKKRIYTTGQSMGCMTSLYLSSKYPDIFAAYLFVSGQWNSSDLSGLENETFFYITAAGDAKASGGQDEVKAMFDKDGVSYSYATWNAQNSLEEQNKAAEKLIAEKKNANMIRFEEGTVFKEGQTGMEHMASFNYAYQITAVRDWLYEQSK